MALAKNFEHPLPVADIDGVGCLPAWEDDIIDPALAVGIALDGIIAGQKLPFLSSE